MLLPKPKDLSAVQAAAMPENWMTGELEFEEQGVGQWGSGDVGDGG
jgi:NADPH:quinone reductase-like Zn-dependent oxidoreductase